MTTTVNSTKQQHQPIAEAGNRPQDDATYTPRVDLWEGDEGVVVHADMPGVTAEGLDIEFEDRELRIHGRVPAGQVNGSLLREYGVGDFRRTFSVGEAIDAENISAELKDGVLTIHLPKVDSVKARRIEVSSN